MITDLAAAAPSCTTGTWSQKWNCGWNQPVPAGVKVAGYNFGHNLLVPLLIIGLIFLVARSVRRRRKSGRTATSGAGR